MRISKVIQILLLAGSVSCQEPYEIPIGETETSFLSISGDISTLPEPYYIRISKTGGRYSIPRAITKANVAIRDENGTTYPFKDLGDGRYRSPDNLIGVAGSTYELSVKIDDGIYKSTAVTIPQTEVTKDSITFSFNPIKEVTTNDIVVDFPGIQVKVKSYLSNLPTPTYLQWKVSSVYTLEPTDFPDPFNSVPDACFISEVPEASRINLVEHLNSEVTETELIVAQQKIDYTFRTRRYYIIEKRVMDEATFRYWKQTNQLINQSGSIFDTPPARLQGNIVNTMDSEEVVVGNFAAYNSIIIRKFVTRGDLPVIPLPYCEYVPEKEYYNYPAVCLNCTSVPNSTTVVPDWWLD